MGRQKELTFKGEVGGLVPRLRYTLKRSDGYAASKWSSLNTAETAMPPAFSTPRAGATPEASRDRLSGIFAENISCVA